jgi:hypothetical protein
VTRILVTRAPAMCITSGRELLLHDAVLSRPVIEGGRYG